MSSTSFQQRLHPKRHNYNNHHHRSKSTPEDRLTIVEATRSSDMSTFDGRSSSVRHRSRINEKSPFSRSKSRVYYASNAMWNDNDDDNDDHHSMKIQPNVNSTSPFINNDVISGQFRRSVHRSNTSYKSQDSGFSDAAEVGGNNVGGSTTIDNSDTTEMTKNVVGVSDSSTIDIPNCEQSTQLSQQAIPSKSNNVHTSPIKKFTKWSSSSSKSPLKMFWKQQDGSNASMLKCCAGMSPFFPFYHHRQIKSSSSISSTTPKGQHSNVADTNQVHITCSPDNKKTPFKSEPNISSNDCTFVKRIPLKSNDGEDNSTGTWPRVGKTEAIMTKPLVPTSSISNNGAYYSTRLKGNQKPKILIKKNPKNDHTQEPNNNFRNTLFVCNSAVQLWLRDMHWSTEDECMNTLQSKAVARDLADVAVIAARNSKDAIVLLHRLCKGITMELKRVKKQIDASEFKSAIVGCDGILFNFRCLMHDTRTVQFNDVPSVQRHLRLVFAHCSILKQLLDRLNRGEQASDNAPLPLDVHFALEMAFDNLFEALVLCHLKNIIDVLEEPQSIRSLKTAVNCVGSLATLHSNLCHLMAKTGSIRSLLTVCIETRFVSIRALVLRSLATLCCSEDSIRELEESGGVDCITDILAENSATEAEKCESAGVIAQITSPLLNNCTNVSGLAQNIPSLIRSLTDLAKSTKSHDVLLLSSAAIGNLTFLASQTCHNLHECDTVSVLVNACLNKNKLMDGKIIESVFIKDQVATILANMAGIPDGRADIIICGGLVLLLCFMQIRPSTLESVAEAAACERVQQKSAIALSRLCSDAKIAQQVISLQGVQRLVRLCKDERERNYSDAVLVACLAVLRKIATACGLDEFKELDATDLVEPRVLDSFLIYSSRQESYV